MSYVPLFDRARKMYCDEGKSLWKISAATGLSMDQLQNMIDKNKWIAPPPKIILRRKTKANFSKGVRRR